MAERGGYVTSVYGAKRPARPGTDVAVAAGQAIADLQLRLWRGAVISGAVRDAVGAPLTNHAVDVVPARESTPTGLTLSNRGQVMTNDLGEFRVFGLAPGTYLVRRGRRPERKHRTCDVGVRRSTRSLCRAGGPVESGRRSGAIDCPRGGAGGRRDGGPDLFSRDAGGRGGDADHAWRRRRTRRRGLCGCASIRTATIPAARSRCPAPQRPELRVVLLGFATPPIAFAGLRFRRAQSRRRRRRAALDLSPAPPGDSSPARAESSVSTPSGYRIADSGGCLCEALHVTGEDVDLGTVTLQPGLTLSGRVTLDPAPGERGPDLTALRVELQAGLLSSASGRSRGGGAPGPRSLQPGPVRSDGTFDVA